MFQVTVNNEESDETYESTWEYMQHIQSDALWGRDRRSFRQQLTDNKVSVAPASMLCLCQPERDLTPCVTCPGLQTDRPEE